MDCGCANLPCRGVISGRANLPSAPLAQGLRIFHASVPGAFRCSAQWTRNFPLCWICAARSFPRHSCFEKSFLFFQRILIVRKGHRTCRSTASDIHSRRSPPNPYPVARRRRERPPPARMQPKCKNACLSPQWASLCREECFLAKNNLFHSPVFSVSNSARLSGHHVH